MSIAPLELGSIAAQLRSGERNLHEFVDECCERIDAVDPDVQAFVCEPDRRDRLHDEADAALSRFPDPDDRPSLFGVPVGIKDIIHVDDLPTRAGSMVPPEAFAGLEATVVTRLREAGALVLGKTVTSEFAGFAPGPTRNPHDLDHTPGGSSSGSAAAVAAGMTPLAVGTQTGGSVIRPAAYCGVVGFKPSYDRIPRDGVIPRSPSIDHVGLFTQGVAGMRLAASVSCDAWEPVAGDNRPTLGVPEGLYLDAASEEALDAFEEQVESLDGAGYDVRRVETFENLESINERFLAVTRAEVARVHDEPFEAYEPFYRVPLADRIRDGRTVTDEALAEGRRGRSETRDDVHASMDAEGIDCWIAPATPGPAPEGITSIGPSDMNRVWTYAGLPTVTVPAGTIGGLPIGLQAVGRFGADERVLAWAVDLDGVLRG